LEVADRSELLLLFLRMLALVPVMVREIVHTARTNCIATWSTIQTEPAGRGDDGVRSLPI